ncbi:hypothetical protein [Pseudomonas sp. SDO55104_S430]
MFKFNKALDLPPQLQWKYASEPTLMAWTIRARNYNTFVANCMFAFSSIFVVGGASYFLYRHPTPEDGDISRILFSLGFFIFFSLLTSSMTHQRMNYAYRFTQSGLEYCEWKEPAKWVLPFLKWFTGIIAIIFIFLATIDPTFLIGALIGPGGMGLMYLSMANSKGFQSLHTEYHHYFIHWNKLTNITIATNRDMVELEFKYPEKNTNDMLSGSQYVFFQRRAKEQVVEFIEAHLPSSVPCVIGKVEVLN